MGSALAVALLVIIVLIFTRNNRSRNKPSETTSDQAFSNRTYSDTFDCPSDRIPPGQITATPSVNVDQQPEGTMVDPPDYSLATAVAEHPLPNKKRNESTENPDDYSVVQSNGSTDSGRFLNKHPFDSNKPSHVILGKAQHVAQRELGESLEPGTNDLLLVDNVNYETTGGLTRRACQPTDIYSETDLGIPDPTSRLADHEDSDDIDLIIDNATYVSHQRKSTGHGGLDPAHHNVRFTDGGALHEVRFTDTDLVVMDNPTYE